MADLVILGGGGHARVLIQLLRACGHRPIGYTTPRDAARELPIPWLGDDDDLLARAAADPVAAVLALGKTDAGDARLQLLTRLRAAGVSFPTLVAPSAVVHDGVELGEGTVVLSGAIVVCGSRLGRACIVNTGASVDHDCVLGNDVHVAPGAVLCGAARVGEHTLVGAGATVVPGVTIAERCVVAAGATVVHDVLEPGLVAGTPARHIR